MKFVHLKDFQQKLKGLSKLNPPKTKYRIKLTFYGRPKNSIGEYYLIKSDLLVKSYSDFIDQFYSIYSLGYDQRPTFYGTITVVKLKTAKNG